MGARPQIFQPFQSLKGFDYYIREKEKVVVEKKELMEDALEELDYQLKNLEAGMMVNVVYDDGNDYVRKRGMFVRVDVIRHSIQVVRTLIDVKSIISLEMEEQ